MPENNESLPIETTQTELNAGSTEDRAEKPAPKDVVVKEELLNSLNAKTKRKALAEEGEFWMFLLGKDGQATESVSIGLGHSWGISANPEQVVADLKSWTEKGYAVIADYHNHPQSSITIYQAAGFPEVYATSPSDADLDMDAKSVRGLVLSRLGQNPYPRIIAAYSKEQDKVLLSAFELKRGITSDESKMIGFNDPTFVEEEPDELGIQIHAGIFTNPSKLAGIKAIEFVDIKTVVANGSIHGVTNDLRDALGK